MLAAGARINPMKTMRILLALVLAPAILASSAVRAADTAGTDNPTRVLFVCGGHEFETNLYVQFFKALPGVSFQFVEHPQAQAMFKADAAKAYDVIVLYDLYQKITDQAKADLVARLKEGKGLLAMHHSIANYQKWPEYEKIIGGKYYLEKTMVNGVEKAVSTWKHDVDFKVHVADTQHPITQGVKDFTIHDETYGGFDTGPEAHVLLTTDEPTSGSNLAWTKTYEGTRVATMVLGHDHQAWDNPNYRQLVLQAIAWVAGKDKK